MHETTKARSVAVQCVRRLCVAALLALAGTVAWAGDDAVDWVKDVTNLMVGPMRADSLPAGKTLVNILDDFQPELAEWSVFQGGKDEALCAHRFFPRFISGGIEYQEYESRWKNWEKHFKTDWAVDEEHGVAMDIHGKPIRHLAWGGEVKDGTRWNVCHNSPRWHELQKESVVGLAKWPRIAVARQDNIGVPVGVTVRGCYCRWCKAGLRKLLAARFTAEDLRKLGIADLEQFDIARYLLDRKLLGSSAVLDDPIAIAWEDFQFTSNLDAWRDIVSATKAVRPMPICGNQGCVNMNAWSSVILSQPNDIIFIEQWTERRYPDSRLCLGYKVECASGRHAKPVWVWGFPTQAAMEQVVGSEIFIAECYANMATPYFLINNAFWSKATGTKTVNLAPKVYDTIAPYARFARSHKDLLTRVYRSHADVALVYSVPSFLYKACSAVEIPRWKGPYLDQAAGLDGLGRVLERLHVPYDVVVFGAPGYWSDDDLTATLGRYKVILLPNVECMTEQQAEAVRRFVQNGGRVIASGDLAVRDERYRRREKPLIGADLGERMASLGDAVTAYSNALRERPKEETGAHQRLTLNQTAPRAIVFRGWSKADHVSDTADGDYSIYLDITFQDGSHPDPWARTANFAVGTHDWQPAQDTVEVEKPVKTVDVYAMFRRHTGTAWFDDIYLGEQGSDKNLLGEWAPYKGGFQPDAAVTRTGKPSIRCAIAPVVPADETQMDTFKKIEAALRQALSGVPPVLETNAPATVFINPVLCGDRLVVHLLNYDCDLTADTISGKQDVRVRIRLPEGAVPGAMTLSVPGAPDAALPAKAEKGFLEFTVPQLRVWAVAHCPLGKG